MVSQNLQAVLAGKPPIEDDEAPVIRPKSLQRNIAIGDVRNGEAFVRQTVDDRSGEARVVLDEQDSMSHDALARKA
jgi:hypothetical protein